MQAPKELTLSVLRTKRDFSQGFSTMRPNTPTMGAERTAADLRRLRRAPGRGSLCLCLEFEALVRVCVCSIVCFFVSLFVSLVGWLFVGIWFFFFVWPLGAPSGVFLQFG